MSFAGPTHWRDSPLPPSGNASARAGAQKRFHPVVTVLACRIVACHARSGSLRPLLRSAPAPKGTGGPSWKDKAVAYARTLPPPPDTETLLQYFGESVPAALVVDEVRAAKGCVG